MSRPRVPLRERLLSMVAIDDTTDCWLWTGALLNNGYAIICRGGANGARVMAHRASYELFVGPIPEGLTIDHVRARGCIHRHCVNPAHLEAVTIRENILRAEFAPAAINARKTACVNGHPFTDENTITSPTGTRGCLTCRRAIGRRHYARNRDHLAAQARARYHRSRAAA